MSTYVYIEQVYDDIFVSIAIHYTARDENSHEVELESWDIIMMEF